MERKRNRDGGGGGGGGRGIGRFSSEESEKGIYTSIIVKGHLGCIHHLLHILLLLPLVFSPLFFYLYIYIYIYTHKCVCVCIYRGEGGGERDGRGGMSCVVVCRGSQMICGGIADGRRRR